jgi:hypothetical protein
MRVSLWDTGLPDSPMCSHLTVLLVLQDPQDLLEDVLRQVHLQQLIECAGFL